MSKKVQLIESWRSKIKNIFKESVEDLQDDDTIQPPVGDASGEVSGDISGAVPEEVESPKVTLDVSLLKSLLDFVKGEEEIEDIDIGDEIGGEEVPETGEEQINEEETLPEIPADAPIEGGDESLEGELEDDEVSVDAIIAKVTELGQSKEVLTDEDFAEIVGETGEEEVEGDMDLGGEEGAAPEEKIQEKVGDCGPARQTGNNGIGK